MEGTANETEVRKRRLQLFFVVAAGAASLGFGIPLVYLLRKRTSATLLHETVNAPPRRTANSSFPPIRLSKPSAALVVEPAQPSSSQIPTPPTNSQAIDDDFNGGLYSAKAFGIATLMVGAGAVATVYGVKTWMGVKTTEEFAHRMRAIVLQRLPLLSERIHRSLDTHDHPVPLSRADADSEVNWNWPDAEKRLQAVFERDGLAAWGEAALQELEAEGRFERMKRSGQADNVEPPQKIV